MGWLRRYRQVQLLATLSLLIFLDPFLETQVGGLLVDGLLTLALLVAVVACSVHRWQLVIGIALTVLVTAGGVYRDYTGIAALNLTYSVLCLMLLVFISGLVLRDVFSGGPVGSEKICGALSAYLFLGLTWAFAYAILEGMSPGSLSGLEAADAVFAPYSRFIGFSFVTITTLGYGNVVPASPQAEALATAEAVVGQVYLTVLVARLVALNLRDADRGGSA